MSRGTLKTRRSKILEGEGTQPMTPLPPFPEVRCRRSLHPEALFSIIIRCCSTGFSRIPETIICRKLHTRGLTLETFSSRKPPETLGNPRKPFDLASGNPEETPRPPKPTHSTQLQKTPGYHRNPRATFRLSRRKRRGNPETPHTYPGHFRPFSGTRRLALAASGSKL